MRKSVLTVFLLGTIGVFFEHLHQSASAFLQQLVTSEEKGSTPGALAKCQQVLQLALDSAAILHQQGALAHTPNSQYIRRGQ